MPDPTPKPSAPSCPICGAGTVVRHCEGKVCGWRRCKNDACKAVIDFAWGRGFRTDPKGRTVTLRLVDGVWS